MCSRYGTLPSELLSLSPVELQFNIGIYKEHLIDLPQSTKGVDRIWTWRERATYTLWKETISPEEIEAEKQRINKWAIECD